MKNKGKWVVDYSHSLTQVILHKEFNDKDKALEWGKNMLHKSVSINGITAPINYLHLVYEPVWTEVQDEVQVQSFAATPDEERTVSSSEIPEATEAARDEERALCEKKYEKERYGRI